MDARPDLSTEEIRLQLQRILASPGFERSRRQADLLAYLVEECLAQRGGRIKATSIAMDVFGRDETFDQQRDTIVRVEAGRLRKRLQAYFEREGSNDPVLIRIPTGTYQPVFVASETADVHTEQSSPAQPGSGESGLKRAARTAPAEAIRKYLPLLAAAILVAGWWLWRPSPEPLPPSRSLAETVAPVSAKPFLMVMPLSAHASDARADRLAFGLVESLIAKLAKLEGLSVMAHASILEQYQQSGSISIQQLRGQYGVSHVLRGSLEQVEGRVALTLQLVDTKSGEILWADRQTHAAGELLAMEEALALRLADELTVQIQPDERARLGASHASDSEAWVFYRQGLVMLIPPNDITRIEAARLLFHRARQLDPGFAGGYAGESFSHSITVLFLTAATPQEEVARALSLAQRAIEVDSEFAMGYAVQSFARLMSGDYEAALANAEMAIELQPGDAFARFIYGMNLSIAGQPRQALPVLREALRLDPLEPRTPYVNVLAITQYSAGLYEEALESLAFNVARGGPRGPHMDLFFAASYAQLGLTDAALQARQRVRAVAPEFPVKAWLSKWLTGEGQLAATMALLEGLE